MSARDDSTMSCRIGAIATGLRANPRCPDWMPANSRICSTISVSRRPSFRTRSPYFRICSSSRTTPSARLSPAERMTASGVRSSWETAATNSICWRASSCARRVERIRRPTLAPSTARMLELTIRFRRRTALTAASSDPDGCLTIRRQRGALGGVIRQVAVGPPARPSTGCLADHDRHGTGFAGRKRSRRPAIARPRREDDLLAHDLGRRSAAAVRRELRDERRGEPPHFGGDVAEVLRPHLKEIHRGVRLCVGLRREAGGAVVHHAPPRAADDRDLIVERVTGPAEMLLRESRQHLADDVVAIEQQHRVRQPRHRVELRRLSRRAD